MLEKLCQSKVHLEVPEIDEEQSKVIFYLIKIKNISICIRKFINLLIMFTSRINENSYFCLLKLKLMKYNGLIKVRRFNIHKQMFICFVLVYIFKLYIGIDNPIFRYFIEKILITCHI